jgi:hypothetical protein
VRAVRPLTPALRRAYARSAYEAGGLHVRIRRRPVGSWPFQSDAFVILGACNPGGRRATDGINARMMCALAERLRHVPSVAGRGGLGQWWEPMTGVCMPLAPARRLARVFGQNAVVLVRRGRPARLVQV